MEELIKQLNEHYQLMKERDDRADISAVLKLLVDIQHDCRKINEACRDLMGEINNHYNQK